MNQRERLIGWIMDSVGGCARHWAEIIADGILERGGIAPPCKVGDTVYGIREYANQITEAKVFAITRYEDEQNMCLQNKSDGADFWFVAIEDFGKTVFTTREAAEQALKERNDENSV